MRRSTALSIWMIWKTATQQWPHDRKVLLSYREPNVPVVYPAVHKCRVREMNGGSAAAAAQSHDSFTDGHHVRLLYCSRTSGALRRTTTTTPYNTISLWPHAHDEIHFWNPVTGVFVNYLGKLSLIFEGETLKLSSSWDQTAWTTGSLSTFVVRGKSFLNFPPLRPDG